MSTKIINVLYVDDEDNNLVSFKAGFRRYFNVFTALSAKKAENILSKKDIHILITDQRMPVKSGTELLAEAVKKYPKQVRILLTGYADIEAVKDAVNRGQIFKYLNKPWDVNELKSAIEQGFAMAVLKDEKLKTEKEVEFRAEDVDLLFKQDKKS